ncbi:MAG TPA: YkgJ family cysteine cluster protein [Myxococcaceae bacterium]|nr:YkgJ family cysteine cluster protein [Myxococcaceae bacterium]
MSCSQPRADAPVCARCSGALKVSCCELAEGESLATLTLTDVARVQAATGWSRRRFVDEEGFSELEALAYERDRPLYRGYFARGPIRLTLRPVNGACVFFRPGVGCRLTAAQRPLACRLFPFELWPDGQWSLQVERHGNIGAARAQGGACLAVEEATSMEEVLEAMHTTRDEVETLGRQLHEEVRSHARGRALPLSPDADSG